MADNLKCACKSYYTDITKVTFSQNWLTYSLIASYQFFSQRPFIPVAILDPTNNYRVDFANSHAFPNFFKQIMEDCLTASYNYLNNIVAAPKYLGGDYGVYLSQRVGVKNASDRLQRYQMIENAITDFWTRFATSGNVTTDLQTFQTLIDFLIKNTDKKYFVAPGTYYVEAPNPSNTTADAINLANPIWANNIPVLILELDSIG